LKCYNILGDQDSIQYMCREAPAAVLELVIFILFYDIHLDLFFKVKSSHFFDLQYNIFEIDQESYGLPFSRTEVNILIYLFCFFNCKKKKKNQHVDMLT